MYILWRVDYRKVLKKFLGPGRVFHVPHHVVVFVCLFSIYAERQRFPSLRSGGDFCLRMTVLKRLKYGGGRLKSDGIFDGFSDGF